MFALLLHDRDGQVSTGDEEIDTAMIHGDVLRTESAMLSRIALYCQRIERSRRAAREELGRVQAARKEREFEEMKDAARLRKALTAGNMPYNPAEDGFVFSLSEIDTYIRRLERREQADIGYRPPPLRRMAA